MPLDSVRQLVDKEFNAVNSIIIENLNSQVGLIEDLSQHIISSGGKRLRPLLLLLSAKACGYEGDKHIPCATAIEYFHTATLLHDDVLDESSLRRGVETANEIWGSKASILVGDYLLTLSVHLLVEVGNLAVLAILVDAAHQITCGEVKQLSNKGKSELSIDEYFYVIRSKTALLFSASAEIGARLSNTTINSIKAMREFGLHLGNAFQIMDDILDYSASSESMGKNCGDDLKDGKLTLPLIYAKHAASPEENLLIEESLKAGSLDNLDTIMAIIKRSGAIDKSLAIARQEIDKALTHLAILEDSPYKKALAEFAQYAIQRDH